MSERWGSALLGKVLAEHGGALDAGNSSAGQDGACILCTTTPDTRLSCQHLAEKQEDQKLKISRTQGVLGQSGLGEGKRGKKSAEDYSKTQLTT